MVTLRKRPRHQRQCNSPSTNNTPDIQPNKRKGGKLQNKNTTTTRQKEDAGVNSSTEGSEKVCSSITNRKNTPVAKTPKSKSVPGTPRPVPSTSLQTGSWKGELKDTPKGLVFEVGRKKLPTESGQGGEVLQIKNKRKRTVTRLSANSVLVKTVSEKVQKKEKIKAEAHIKAEDTPEENEGITTPKKKKTPASPKVKSPLRLALKPEKRVSNDVFKVPRASLGRKQRVSMEMCAEVQSQITSLSVCNVITNKRRKREDKKEKSIVPDSKHPLFVAGISPIVSQKEKEKLDDLEKSMNLFECPMSPIAGPQQKENLSYSYLALKSDIKSLPKRARTKAAGAGKKKKSSKEDSLLKTPLRQVFKSKTVEQDDDKETSLLFEDSDSEGGEEEEGYTMYPLSLEDSSRPNKTNKSTSKATNKSSIKEKAKQNAMDYESWLDDHKEDYNQYKDLDLCVE